MELLNNKTINGLTRQYISIVRQTEGNGLKKRYMFEVYKNITNNGLNEEIVKSAIEALKKTDKEMNTRYNRNIIAAFGRLLKIDTHKAVAECKMLTEKGFKEVGYTELVNAFKPLKSGFKAAMQSNEKLSLNDNTETVANGKVILSNGEDTVTVDTKQEINDIKNELINRAVEIATASVDDLIDTYLETAGVLEDALMNFDPKKRKEQTATIVAMMEKLIDTMRG